MKRLSITIVILFMVLAVACNKSSKEGSGSNSGTAQTATASPNSSKDSPLPGPKFSATIPSMANNSATAPGMNPPHGQPNHRCDIAVGAPLNSPPGKSPTQPITVQPNVNTQTTTTPTTATSTAAGMNPPHGQPNHRCDIAVGAPLDSPPGTGKTQPPASQPNATTQITTTPTTTTSTAPGINPPHGQPNHRCDIKVGAPLDSPSGK